MKFSLLYKIEEEQNPCDVLYNLSVDRSVGAVSGDVKRNDYFLGILGNPLTCVENILYRQQIYADLAAYPQLLDDMKLVFTRYDKIKQDWRESRSNAVPAGAGGNAEAMLEYTFASLQVTAMFPKTIISFFELIGDTIGRYEVKSEGLIAIRDYCAAMLENDSLAEIDRISSLFRYYTPEKFTFGVVTEIDDALRLASLELATVTERTEKKANAIGDILHKVLCKKKNDGDGSVEAGEDARDDAFYTLNEALAQLDNLLVHVTYDIYETFFGISREINFYDTALELMGYLEGIGLPTVMPQVMPMEADYFSAKGLYDMLIATDGREASEVIPNDFTLDDKWEGLLVRGKNNSGKTVFLRSVGTAQLFAQAGLPVCAKSAMISVRMRIFAHFSSAEEEFTLGDTAGRFEGEVKEIARIIDNLKPYSLILFNETFQTTAYSEGAVGMYEILGALPGLHTKYIFVTHLTKLFDLCSGGKVRLAQTDPESRTFKIIPING